MDDYKLLRVFIEKMRPHCGNTYADHARDDLKRIVNSEYVPGETLETTEEPKRVVATYWNFQEGKKLEIYLP